MPPTVALGANPTTTNPPDLPPPHSPPLPSAATSYDPELEQKLDEAAESNRNQLTGFKIATVALSVLTVILVIFAVTLNNRYQSLVEETQNEITTLQQQVEALQVAAGGVLATDAQQIAKLQEELKALKSQLKGTEKDLNQQAQEITQDRKEYEELQEKADKRAASDAQKLKAADARADLASQCAVIAYQGLIEIYENFTTETLTEVAQILRRTGAECSSILK
ncbi:MAG: hypothetical protein K0U60_10370 [Actinomycetia bacterium]|nr:hypothetical protein [Actinomycetes bacterium]MCH9801578.1 hypothetical protein [Actinomycetes bacterium]